MIDYEEEPLRRLNLPAVVRVGLSNGGGGGGEGSFFF